MSFKWYTFADVLTDMLRYAETKLLSKRFGDACKVDGWMDG